MTTVIIVEDEAIISMQLSERLTSVGYTVVGCAFSGEDSVEMARALQPDVILMDIVMPGKMDGIEAARIIKNELDIPVIFITAWAGDEFVDRAKYAQPSGYIVKPFQINEIKAAIEVALHKKKAERELCESEERFRFMIGSLEEGVVSAEADAGIVFMNRAAEILFGYPAGAMYGEPLTRLFATRCAGEFSETIDMLFEHGTAKEYVKLDGFNGLKKDGSEFPVVITVVPRHINNKAFVNCIIRDLSSCNADARNQGAGIKSDDIISICSYCKKIRNLDDSWEGFESYMIEHCNIRFSHSICPDCMQRYYPDY